jgi:hypothetical protein
VYWQRYHELQWGELVFESEMYPILVVPQKPLKKLSIEGFKIHPKLLSMEVSELFLHGAVKMFTVSVLLGGAGSRVEVGQVKFKKHITKVLLELASIVSEYVHKRKWKDTLAQIKEVSSCQGCMASSRKSESKTSIEVNESNDVASRTVYVLFKGIECNHVTWVQSLKSFGFPKSRDSGERLDSTGTSDAQWHLSESTQIFHEATDGTGLGARKMVHGTEL